MYLSRPNCTIHNSTAQQLNRFDHKHDKWNQQITEQLNNMLLLHNNPSSLTPLNVSIALEIFQKQQQHIFALLIFVWISFICWFSSTAQNRIVGECLSSFLATQKRAEYSQSAGKVAFPQYIYAKCWVRG